MAEYDVVVAGGGVAGLTAGLFAARHGRSTAVLCSQPGGALLSIARIDDFPGFPEGVAGFDIGPLLQEQAMTAGAMFLMSELTGLEQADGGWRIVTPDEQLSARAVVLATGTRPRTLDVPGEERLTGRGISHCASCDGPLHRDKVAIVVGAGDSGLLEALELAQYAERVVVLEREAAPTAQAIYRDRVAATASISVRCESVVEEVLGDDRVAGVRVRDLAGGSTEEIEASAVFVYVGATPETAFLEGLVALDSEGRVPTDALMRTELPGLFAAGSIRSDSVAQAAAAAGDGATAAVAAHRYLVGGAVPAGAVSAA